MNQETLQRLHQLCNKFIQVYPTIIDDFTEWLNINKDNINSRNEKVHYSIGVFIIKTLVSDKIEKIAYE